jgi:hypothetical protein
MPVPVRKTCQTALARYLEAKRKPGTDDVRIGADIPDNPGEKIPIGSMADVAAKVEGVRFLLRPWVPAGMVTLLVAEPGEGKSALAMYGLVRPVVTGCSWFNLSAGPKPGFALWVDTESCAAINVQRIADWGLPADRILVPFADDPLKAVSLIDEDHLAQIEAVVVKRRCRLVVVDSLRGSHGEDENNSRVGRVVQNLGTIAERTGTAVVLIHHCRKLAVDEEATANSARGSNAIVALCRSQLIIDRPDKTSEWRRLRVGKENLGISPKPVGFKISTAGLEFGSAPDRPRKETRRDQAEDWLEANMTPGKWQPAGELLKGAKKAGYSGNAIQRAREVLKITKPNHVRKTVKGWEWRLPGQETTDTQG